MYAVFSAYANYTYEQIALRARQRKFALKLWLQREQAGLQKCFLAWAKFARAAIDDRLAEKRQKEMMMAFEVTCNATMPCTTDEGY